VWKRVQLPFEKSAVYFRGRFERDEHDEQFALMLNRGRVMWDKNEQGDLPSIINHRVRAFVKTRWDRYIAQANATGYTELQIAGIHSGGRTHGTFGYDSRDHSGKYVADMKEIGFSGTDDGIDGKFLEIRGLHARLERREHYRLCLEEVKK
jgi:hypothetical protein